jgi:radical SAM protein with 4Fe4S-binding SPASM domain
MRRHSTPDCVGGAYRPAGLLLQWHITERCNLRCAHCYQERYLGAELSYPALIEVLGQYRSLLENWRRGPSGGRVRGHVTVTGGEPFLRADCFDLLQTLSASARLFTFAILTNGTLIDGHVARRLRKLAPAFVQVSIEGTRPTHDGIRGAGNFDRTVEAIHHLIRQRVRTFISFSAHGGNFREFPEVCRIGRELGVSRIWADRIIPCGSGKSLQNQVLQPEETRALFRIMNAARCEANRQRRASTRVAMHRALQFLVAGGRLYHCTAGDSLITVLPNGDVYPCRRLPIRVGNLLETSLAELYYRHELLLALRDRQRVPAECRPCHFAQFCRGGLRCLAQAVLGSPFARDPGCWIAAKLP